VPDLLTLDTNVLIYVVDSRDAAKQRIAQEILAGVRSANVRLTTISLGEFFHVSTRKRFLSAANARRTMAAFSALAPVVPYDIRHLSQGAAEAEAGRFSFWDAVILASAEEAGCTICVSEDMGHGTRLGNIRVSNPFGPRGIAPDVRALLVP
jgi:predicted nucleic acid-binding protein